MHRTRKHWNGFTLIELLVVIAMDTLSGWVRRKLTVGRTAAAGAGLSNP